MHFDEMIATKPDLAAYRALCDHVAARIGGDDVNDAEAAVAEWDLARRTAMTWLTTTMVRFALDVRDEAVGAANDEANEMAPQVDALDDGIRRALLASPHREALEASYGSHVFDLWQADADAFTPELVSVATRERKMVDRVMASRGGAEITIEGREGTFTLEGLRPLMVGPDRALRKAATEAFWSWHGERADEIDATFDALATIRQDMATTLGFETYTAMGYERMRRVGYGPDDVAAFRKEVVRTMRPLAERLETMQAERLGLAALEPWDRGCYAPEGNPVPQGDAAWMQDRASEMFAELDPRLKALFDRMREQGTLDLEQRAGKQPGGFCTSLYDFELPFVFANFSGTDSDVVVFTHEMGHAFQFWQCRDVPVVDLVTPTYETAEVLSMGLEFLTRPYMELFFGTEGARTYRWIHLARTVNGLLRWASGDHWQHLVYASPDASPADRRAMWQEVESIYTPNVEWGELELPASGGYWHPIGHVFFAPFYLIDYALAGTAALQLWALDDEDHDQAMDTFVELAGTCTRKPHHRVLSEAGLRSPFEAGSLERVAATIDRELDRV